MSDLHPENILIYRIDDNRTRIEVKLEEKTIWLSQKQVGELYQKSKATISEHIKNIYQDGELEPEATVRKFRTVQKEGDRQVERVTEHYNLDMILAIGYRVRSHVGTQFRQWATGVLTEYIIKGFVLDDERLKNPDQFGDDYFDELLQRIQDIRTSERRFYQKITDIYTLSIDYEPRFRLNLSPQKALKMYFNAFFVICQQKSIKLYSKRIKNYPQVINLYLRVIKFYPRVINLYPAVIKLYPRSIKLDSQGIKLYPKSINLYPGDIKLYP